MKARRIESKRWFRRSVALAWIVLVGTASLWTVDQANAGLFGPSHPFGPEEEAAWTQAEAYWGRQPTLCTSITKEVVAQGALDGPDAPGGAAGRATQPNAPMECGIWIEEGLGPNLCGVIRHEYSHLLGYSHQDPELANMPRCDSESNDPSGGIYSPADIVVVERNQRWELWREWIRGCREKRLSKSRRATCFRNVRHLAVVTRRWWGV